MGAKNNIVRTVKTLRTQTGHWKMQGKKVALVPTMGALHEGHLSLARLAKKKADRVVVSIFVNPSQFGPKEDLSKYPRTENLDKAKLDQIGTDLIFVPKLDQMYPEGFSTEVTVTGITDVLCGSSRPTHFKGVATIVTKLLLQAMPDIAIFGEKDYQQLLVIKRLVTDLNIPVRIIGGAIVREKDGLAMSSRNAYLSTQERETAPQLNKSIKQLAKQLSEGEALSQAVANAKKSLTSFGFKIDYLEIRDANTLDIVEGKIQSQSRIFVAAFLGKTRLIDNIKVRLSKK